MRSHDPIPNLQSLLSNLQDNDSSRTIYHVKIWSKSTRSPIWKWWRCRELNLTIERGELVGIIGSSGSGKSTLMNVLGGLDRPSAGKVKVDGQDLLKMSDRQLNRYRLEKVGFVWQQSARNLVPYLNAIQNVMLPMTLFGPPARKRRTGPKNCWNWSGWATQLPSAARTLRR